MYILGVLFTSGAVKRYAYGNENEALVKMRKWINLPCVEQVDMEEVATPTVKRGNYEIRKERARSGASGLGL